MACATSVLVSFFKDELQNVVRKCVYWPGGLVRFVRLYCTATFVWFVEDIFSLIFHSVSSLVNLWVHVYEKNAGDLPGDRQMPIPLQYQVLD